MHCSIILSLASAAVYLALARLGRSWAQDLAGGVGCCTRMEGRRGLGRCNQQQRSCMIPFQVKDCKVQEPGCSDVLRVSDAPC